MKHNELRRSTVIKYCIVLGDHSKALGILPLPPLCGPVLQVFLLWKFHKTFHETATCTFADLAVLFHENNTEIIEELSVGRDQRRRIFLNS